MKFKPTILYASEMLHRSALQAVHRAVRADDLKRAEHWLRIAERVYRLHAHSRAAARERAASWRAIRQDRLREGGDDAGA
jgi:hypothetical protein